LLVRLGGVALPEAGGVRVQLRLRLSVAARGRGGARHSAPAGDQACTVDETDVPIWGR
jgi:hypothetical protein